MEQDPEFDAHLTLDEFRLVLESAPAEVVVPAALSAGTFESSGADATTRRETARNTLTERGLMDIGGLHPLIVLALTMPLAARSAIQVQSWTPETSSQTLVSSAGRLVSIVTVTVERVKTLPATDVRTVTAGSATITVGGLPLVVDRLDHLLDDAPPEPAGVRPLSVTLGLVESRSLVEAVRQGDDEVVAQLAELLGAARAVPILRTLAATAESGLRLRAFVEHGRPLFRASWFQGSTGAWVTMRVLAGRDGGGEVSAQSLTDAGRLELGRFRRSAITAELISVVSAFEVEAARGR